MAVKSCRRLQLDGFSEVTQSFTNPSERRENLHSHTQTHKCNNTITDDKMDIKVNYTVNHSVGSVKEAWPVCHS